MNADNHSVMKQMHKLGDEKRSIVILRPADYDEWLHMKHVDAARAMLHLLLANEMTAEVAPESAPKWSNQRASRNGSVFRILMHTTTGSS